jgi:hypothetical protein
MTARMLSAGFADPAHRCRRPDSRSSATRCVLPALDTSLSRRPCDAASLTLSSPTPLPPVVRQDLQKHGTRQLSRREVGPPVVLRVDRGGAFYPAAAARGLQVDWLTLRTFIPTDLQIKPLTEEEKKQRLEELRANMAAKRAVKAKQEAEENKANEALRRKSGRDQGEIREQMKAKEAQKEALARKKGACAEPLAVVPDRNE